MKAAIHLLVAALGLGLWSDGQAQLVSSQNVKDEFYAFVTQSQIDGKILRLDDLRPSFSNFGVLLDKVTFASDIVSGPDGRLYFNELFAEGNSVHRIWRVESDGKSRTLVVEWKKEILRPGGMVFASNGDLYFGTVSVAAGQPTSGIWRIRGASSAGRKFSAPEQVLSSELLPRQLPQNKAAAVPAAFLTVGPFVGDLLVVYDPDYFAETSVYSRGEVMRAVGPNFGSIESFIPSGDRAPFEPAGLTIDGKGDVFVTDAKNGTILRYGPNGKFKELFVNLKYANQVTTDKAGTVYVTNAHFDSRGIIEGGLFLYDANGDPAGSVSSKAFLRGVTTSTLSYKIPTPPEGCVDILGYCVSATVLAAIIGAIGTIIGATIGAIAGIWRGKQKSHSVLRFLNIQGKQLKKAEKAIGSGDHRKLEAIANAIVDNTQKMQRVQRSLAVLLNGRITELRGALDSGRPELVERSILALKEGFDANYETVKTEIEREQI